MNLTDGAEKEQVCMRTENGPHKRETYLLPVIWNDRVLCKVQNGEGMAQQRQLLTSLKLQALEPSGHSSLGSGTAVVH